MDVYVAKGSERDGPYDAGQIMDMVRSGALKPESLVWHEELSDWQRADTVFDFSEAGKAPAVAPAPPRGPGRATVAGGGGEKPGGFSFDRRAEYQQGVEERRSRSVELAGRGSRLVAVLLNNIVLGVAGIPALVIMIPAFTLGKPDAAIPGGILLFLAFVIVGVVQVVMLSKSGQSIGKRMVGIRIATLEGEESPGFFKVIILRAVVPAIINAVPFVGGIFGLVDILFIFRDDRRCIHDLIAGTHVVASPRA